MLLSLIYEELLEIDNKKTYKPCRFCSKENTNAIKHMKSCLTLINHSKKSTIFFFALDEPKSKCFYPSDGPKF